MLRAMTVTATLGITMMLGACANDTLFTSSADAGPSVAAVAPRPAVDPACSALATKIDGLRREGVVERVEAAAKGKGSTVSVKRASLAQVAELEKANAEFQAKCSTVPRAQTAAVTPPAAAVGAPKAAVAKAATAKAATAPKPVE